MRLKNEEWKLLDTICDYLMVLEDSRAQEHYVKLALLLNTLLDRKVERNKFVCERVAQRRKTDKTYAQRNSYKDKVNKKEEKSIENLGI